MDKFLSALGILKSNISSDFSHSLKADASQFEHDFYEIKKEVQDSMTAGIIRAGEYLELPNLTEQPTSRIADFFNFSSAYEGYEDVGELLNRYAETLTQYSDNELKKDIYRYANRFTNEYILKEASLAELGKGSISFSRPSGTEISLFGENRAFQNFFSLDISFASETQMSNGKIAVNEFVNFLNIWLSPYQAMELVQCSLTGGWIKGTLKRFCNKGVTQPLPGDEDHANVKIDSAYSSPYICKIEKLIEEAVDIVTNHSATKGRRARLVEIIEEMAPILEKEEVNRRDAFKLKQERLYDEYSANSKKELSRIISGFEESHPAIFHKFKKLMQD